MLKEHGTLQRVQSILSNRRWMLEISIRLCVILTMLLNAMAPTIGASAGSTKSGSSNEQTGTTRSLTSQSHSIYQPTEKISMPSVGTPPAQPKPEKPPKNSIEFTIAANPALVSANGQVILDVVIRNNLASDVTNLIFSDQLENGYDYSWVLFSPIQWNAGQRVISYNIGTLKAGDQFTFSYKLNITNKNSGGGHGILRIHDAQIGFQQNGQTVSQKASTGFTDSSDLVGNNTTIGIPDPNNDGWQTLGRYSIHLGDSNLLQNTVVIASPTQIQTNGKDPDLQFQLDLVHTDAVGRGSDNTPNEQVINFQDKYRENFTTPAFLEINMDGLADLNNIPAGQQVYVATYDDASRVWVKVPIIDRDLKRNTVTVKAAHFSTWGAGLGTSLPQNGANVLLFDQPFTSLFTGAARYSIPIWTPSGRAGMSPDISL